MTNQLYYLFKTCLSILFLYPCTNYILSFNEKYNTYNYNKKCYIIKNLIKSVFLLYCSLMSFRLLRDAYYNEWNNEKLNKFATLYVSNDIIGLLTVPKLPFSTKLHHLTTTCMLLYSFLIDFREDNVGRLLFMLCIFSSFSFLVNTYLGLRHFRDDKSTLINQMIEYNRSCAYNIYGICCFFNWLIQLFIILNKILSFNLGMSYIVYMVFLAVIINDDIVLLNWLHKDKNKVMNI